jgi:hypothetical protein
VEAFQPNQFSTTTTFGYANEGSEILLYKFFSHLKLLKNVYLFYFNLMMGLTVLF